jgi:membrane-associated phospholipid phosphatase
LGLAISSFYKVFTGRIPPPHFLGHGPLVDISHGFRLGFLRGGIYEGWPSSHSTIAFAMAVVLWKLYPENQIARYAALLYAFYVSIGVFNKNPNSLVFGLRCRRHHRFSNRRGGRKKL